MATYLDQLHATSGNINFLRAEYEGLEKVNEIITKVLKRLQARADVQQQWSTMQGSNMTMADFDGWFAPLVRKELGKTLAIVRAKAMQKVPANAKADASAILRRQYKNDLAGNINILTNKKRISYKTRTYPERTGGASGIRRPRTVSERTKKLYEYSGPDRGFILRFLEYGTDVRTAHSSGPSGRGSKATYGNRGNIGARSFFGQVKPEMDAAARELGTTLVNYVEKWIEQIYNETA